jgi:pimeloyl-ACP methyl ester carboxylesterase
MVTLEQMRALDADAISIPGAGHNAHWEKPEAVWQYVERCMTAE